MNNNTGALAIDKAVLKGTNTICIFPLNLVLNFIYIAKRTANIGF